MGKLTKETFEQWVKDNKWLQIGEASTTNGRQITYLAPSGEVTSIIQNINGDIEIAKPPVFTIPLPTMGQPPLNLLGKMPQKR